MTSVVDKISRRLSDEPETKFEIHKMVDRFTDILSQVSDISPNEKLAKAITYGSFAVSLFSTGKSIYDFYKKSQTPPEYTIKISEDDAIFEIVEDWFMEALPEDKQKSVFARSSVKRGNGRRRSRSEEMPDYGGASSIGPNDEVDILYSFDGQIAQELSIAGHKVTIYTETPEGMGSMDMGKKFKVDRTIHIVCPTIQARDAVLTEIRVQAQHLSKAQPTIFASHKYGGFVKRSSLKERTKESVVLKEGQMDRILGHINTFLGNKEAYLKAGIPFRTGVLLHGEPGSGKSSTAAAIANELNMDVYIVSLASISDDDSLSECFSGVPSNSVIILEDIDIAHAVKERDNDSGVTMTGMLNVLDGFSSAEGVITIMTTNRLDVLDEAIIRPGRVDLMENLDCLDNYQLRGLCEYFIGYIPENLPYVTPADGISSAEILGVVRKHLPTFENAGEDLVRFICSKVLTPATA